MCVWGGKRLSQGLRASQTQVQVLALAFMGCVTLEALLALSELSMMGLIWHPSVRRLSEIRARRSLARCLALSKHSRNFSCAIVFVAIITRKSTGNGSQQT